MAQEVKRGCGYRRVGGLYLVGDFHWKPCDRLPLEVGHCPVCGHGVHFSRNAAEINPFRLWGEHTYKSVYELPHPKGFPVTCQEPCSCIPCFVCQPPDDTAFIMMVGEKFYPKPQDFIEEATKQGISKRIPALPKKLVLGETIIYLAHRKACNGHNPQQSELLEGNGQGRLLDAEKKAEPKLGIFAAFVPRRIEKLIWESQATEKVIKDLEKRGITPVIIKDGDKDHA